MTPPLTIAVIDLPRGKEVDRLMAIHEGAIVAVLEGGDRAYILILVDGRGPDGAFVDLNDGERLLGSHFFDSEAEARAWVAADFARRTRPRGVQ